MHGVLPHDFIGTGTHVETISRWPLVPVGILNARDIFYKHGLTLIPSWIINYIHYNMWDEITYPFPNFNGATVEVWKWISNFTPHFIGRVITYPCWD